MSLARQIIVIACFSLLTASWGYADIGYPPIGIPYSTGSQWGASYRVGTLGNNLVQLDSLGRLPALDGSLLFNLSGGGGKMVYPPSGVPASTGTAWGSSYAVGTAANNLVQLDGSARLPAVDGSQLRNLPGGMPYPSAGVALSTGSSWGVSYRVGVSANELVQLDSQARLPSVDGSQLKNLPSGGGMVYPTGGIPYSSGTGWNASIAAVNNGIVQFSATGEPMASVSLPENVSIDGRYIYHDGGAPVRVSDGGTGLAQWAPYAIPYASSTSKIGQILRGESGQVLTVDPTAVSAYSWVTPRYMVFPSSGIPSSTGSAWGSSYSLGTKANNIVQLDSYGRLPPVDGSQLSNLPATMVFPPSGVPSSTGTAWGNSYTVGTGAQNLVQLDGSVRLPAVDGSQLTNLTNLANKGTVGAGQIAVDSQHALMLINPGYGEQKVDWYAGGEGEMLLFQSGQWQPVPIGKTPYAIQYASAYPGMLAELLPSVPV